ncbi:MAG: toll/interleukin-1 receptor domain-containing protein [Deltaproteobacteria bacterium]|nr:toll/interleukin-1 receptor domain-containing protein [Deltaproteobacteria bacterium]
MNNLQKPLQLFYSYAHDDEKLCELLIKHLASLRRQNILHGWYDRCISPGDEWANEIDMHLERADIVLLLISASFVDSNYCWGIEMERALQKHNAEEAMVLPIILRPVDIEGTPFSKLQFLPKDGKPVTRWSDRHEALANIAIGIRHVATKILNEKEKEKKKIREAQLAIMSPVEREIELFIEKHKQDPDVYLLRAIEEGQWNNKDIAFVAKRIKQIMVEMKKWRPKYSGKNTARLKKHKRTLKVMRYLNDNQTH